MSIFDRAWELVKTDFDFIEGVPWERRVDHIAQKLANHYSPKDKTGKNQEEYEYQKKLLEQEIERRKDSRYPRDGRLIFPTDESQHDQIGPGFMGQYRSPDKVGDLGHEDGEELHDERILFNLPELFNSTRLKVARENRKRAGDRYSLTDMYNRLYGPGSDRFEEMLIENIIRNINHEFGHAITNDEMERFDEEFVDWDSWDVSERTADDPISRHRYASEALAHIMEDPHNPNWRERFERHDDIYRWIMSDEQREKYYDKDR